MPIQKLDVSTALPEKIPAHKKQLTLSNEMVEQLEHSSSLQLMIRTEREAGGWRVSFLDSHSPFAQAGFNEGDLITSQALQSLGEFNPEDPSLPARFRKVLTQVLE